MPSKSLVAIRRLHEDGRLGEALGEDLPADVVEADALADVPPRLLHHRVPVHVRQEAEAEPLKGGMVKSFEQGCVNKARGSNLSALLGSVKPSTMICG